MNLKIISPYNKCIINTVSYDKFVILDSKLRIKSHRRGKSWHLQTDFYKTMFLPLQKPEITWKLNLKALRMERCSEPHPSAARFPFALPWWLVSKHFSASPFSPPAGAERFGAAFWTVLESLIPPSQGDTLLVCFLSTASNLVRAKWKYPGRTLFSSYKAPVLGMEKVSSIWFNRQVFFGNCVWELWWAVRSHDTSGESSLPDTAHTRHRAASELPNEFGGLRWPVMVRLAAPQCKGAIWAGLWGAGEKDQSGPKRGNCKCCRTEERVPEQDKIWNELK